MLIQLANLRAAHMKATAQATHQNVERLESELAAARSEQHAAMEEHRRLAEQHSETLKMMEDLTNSRKKLEQELEIERNLRKKASNDMDAMRDSLSPLPGRGESAAGVVTDGSGGGGPRYSTSRGSNGSSRGSSRGGSRRHSIDGTSRGSSNNNNNTASDSAANAVLKTLTNDSVLCSIPFAKWNDWIKRARAVNLELDSTFDVVGGVVAGESNTSSSAAADSSPAGVGAMTSKKKDKKKKVNNTSNSKSLADANNPLGYLAVAQNMTTNPVARLMQKALESMEIDSGLDAAAIEASKGGKSKKKTPFATSKSGVSIEELRRLMNRPPPWKQPAAGALRKERKDSVAVNTNEETGITEYCSRQPEGGGDRGGGGSKKKGRKKAEAVRMCYFTGRGTGEDVPEFLRFNGRVRNRHLGKAQVERIVRLVWVRKEQQRNKDKLSDFFLNGYLKKDFGPSMTIVVEQAYNIVHALERYRNDTDCDMFLKILMGSLPEQAFVDQQLLLRRVQVRFGNIIVNRHSGVEGGHAWI